MLEPFYVKSQFEKSSIKIQKVILTNLDQPTRDKNQPMNHFVLRSRRSYNYHTFLDDTLHTIVFTTSSSEKKTSKINNHEVK